MGRLGWCQLLRLYYISLLFNDIKLGIKIFNIKFYKKGLGKIQIHIFIMISFNLQISAFEFGYIIWPILIGIAILWAVNWFICYKGVKGGIEKLNKILLPLLIIIMIIIVIRGVTLEGATIGLNKLFTPDWSKMLEPQVWIAAYGQVFFSLSVGMGIMMTFSSYLPKKSDINNSAFMTAFANCGFEFLCAIGVFGILGFMASSQGLPFEEVVSGGIGLAFIVFPKVFGLMGVWGTILGVLFFTCLVFAGLTSSVSLVEAVSSAVIDKTGWERKKVVSLICGVGFIVSIAFATRAGLYLLDIIDNFVNNYGIVVIGLLEAFVIGWIIKPETIRNHTNSVSYYRIGKWWDIIIKYVTPAILAIMLISSIITEIKTPYGGYSTAELITYGWAIVGIGIIGALLFSKMPWKNKNSLDFDNESEVA